jgi:anaerobic magnesium-protoporphyrin IX monomethyl ester cyclase
MLPFKRCYAEKNPNAVERNSMSNRGRIVLINPGQSHRVSRLGKIYNRVWLPLSLANCAALLEQQGHCVQIIDANALRLSPDMVAEEASGCAKAFVCSADIDRWQCPPLDLAPFLSTVEHVKNVTGEVYVLGPHGTIKPEEILKLTNPKAVIVGEPEFTVAEICRGASLDAINGVAYSDNGNFRITRHAKPVDLDSLPAPAFHLLPMDRYHYEVLGPRFALFEASRGCASNCRFCMMKMYGRGVRKKKVEKLISEVELAVSRFGVRTAYFMDLEFTVLRNQVLELCEYLIQRHHNFKWTCQTRFDLVDSHLLKKMKEAGCSLIHFGVEAGTDDLLQKINKQISIEQIREGMRLVKEAQIDSACFFMLGFPGSSSNDIAETVRFARQLNPTYALFHLVTPYPGTPIYSEIEKSHPSIVRDVLFPEACCQGPDLANLKSAIRRAYLGYYLRPGYIKTRISRGNLRSLSDQIRLMWGYLR